MTFSYTGGKIELDLSSRKAAEKSRNKVREMDEAGVFFDSPNMPNAALRFINEKYPPQVDWDGLGVSKDAAIRPNNV